MEIVFFSVLPFRAVLVLQVFDLKDRFFAQKRVHAFSCVPLSSIFNKNLDWGNSVFAHAVVSDPPRSTMEAKEKSSSAASTNTREKFSFLRRIRSRVGGKTNTKPGPSLRIAR